MPLPVRTKSLRIGTRERSENVETTGTPGPTKQRVAGKSTDERIEAARQRRLSLSSREETKGTSEPNSITNRKGTAPPSSFKTPARPIRRSRESRSDTSHKDGSAVGGHRTPSRTRSSSRAEDDSISAGKLSSRAKRLPSLDIPQSIHAKEGSKGLRYQQPENNPRKASTRSSSITSSPTKPSFSTHQQHFTPAKKLPHHAASTSSHSKISAGPPPTNRTLEQLKAQTNLLHLSLLHDTFHTTHPQWTASAYNKLNSRFLNLQQAYADCLRTARMTRQARNLLALSQWCSGNDVALVRKMGTLNVILGELCELTKGDSAWNGCPEARLRGWWVEEGDDSEVSGGPEEMGEYTRLVRQFDAWVAWVEEVWLARDRIRGVDDDVDSPISSPVRRPSSYGAKDIREDLAELATTQLEGLGDCTKSSLKALGKIVGRSVTRLEELREPEIPVPMVGLDQVTDEEPGVGPVPTPKIIVDLAWKLATGMKEELQVIREIEFEVIIGEKAWREQRLRQVGKDMVDGFSTPLAVR